MRNKRLLVGTRKGLLVLEKHHGHWDISADFFTGIPVNLVFEDSRNGAWWVALDHGHWGNKLHMSLDQGSNWTEVIAPAYPEGSMVKEGVPATLRYIWAFAEAGGPDDRSIWIGTEPGGLFFLNGEGQSRLIEGLWNHPSRQDHWFGGGRDYAGIHSIVVDPVDPNHLYVGISVAGVFESLDGGTSWRPVNKGLRADFLPDPDTEVGHDPHLLVTCGSRPEVMWQQNHCGIFRSVNGGATWNDISDREGAAYFGFAIAADKNDSLRAWVAPASSDEVRVAKDKSLCVCRTDDGGISWNTFRNGLPQSYCYDLVYRHALVADEEDVFFGTTTGNLFASGDGGEFWTPVSNYLPMVYSLAWSRYF